MRIAVAQTRPVRGDIQENIEHHQRLIDLAISGGASLIIFPELSLTGYEPGLAQALATDPDDERFDRFQEISDTGKITIGVGIPTIAKAGTRITLLLIQPQMPRRLYSKKHLHADEESFFISGQNFTGPIAGRTDISLAICYELSVPEHPEEAAKRGARIYIAGVAKTVTGVKKALTTLADIAATYSMTVMMANSIGQCEEGECAGKTTIWNNHGVRVGQLDDRNEGILIIDTETQEIISRKD